MLSNYFNERVNALNVSRLEREYIQATLEDVEGQENSLDDSLKNYLEDDWDTYDLVSVNTDDDLRQFVDAAFWRAVDRHVCREGLILILEEYYEDAATAYINLTGEEV